MLIYLAQLTHEHRGIIQNLHFPLAIGFISEYLKKNLSQNVSIETFKQPSKLSKRLDEQLPDVIMFSNYIWNTNLNLEFIKAIKQTNPNILTIMGGPNISNDRKKRIEFMKKNHNLDFYVIYEGEKISYEIIKNFIETNNINKTKELSIDSTISIVGNKVFCSEPKKENRISSIEYENIPSPYLSGSFDKYFNDSFIPMIETNRGCPFTCTFCQQGSSYSSKIVNFSNERIKKEIDYIAKRIKSNEIKSYSLEIADSNFGMYKKDAETSLAIRYAQDNYNYPIFIHTSTGKNKIDTILKNLSTLKPDSTFLSLSMQSMNDETLKAVKRQNINIDNYKAIYEYQNKNNLRSVSEIMLGLPKESLNTHIDMLYYLIDLGIDEFSLLQTITLDGTDLETEESRNKYGIKYMYRPIQEAFGEYDILNKKTKICETEKIITQTNTMSVDDYYKARKIHFIISLFHNTNLIKPMYELLKKFNIKPSELIKQLFNTKNEDFNEIINGFLKDTKMELFENAEKIIHNDNVEKYTHNKIFKHIGIAFFIKKDVVLNALKEAAIYLMGKKNTKIIEEMLVIIENSMINLICETNSVEIALKNKAIKDIYGERILLYPSEKQKKLLSIFSDRYPNFEDKVNNIICHLRPANLCLNITNITDEIL